MARLSARFQRPGTGRDGVDARREARPAFVRRPRLCRGRKFRRRGVGALLVASLRRRSAQITRGARLERWN